MISIELRFVSLNQENVDCFNDIFFSFKWYRNLETNNGMSYENHLINYFLSWWDEKKIWLTNDK
jgi:hypothetical protein